MAMSRATWAYLVALITLGNPLTVASSLLRVASSRSPRQTGGSAVTIWASAVRSPDKS